MVWNESGTRDGTALHLAGLCLAMLAVACLAIGVGLTVTCAASTLPSGNVGCRYPFQAAGGTFIYVATLVGLLAFNVFWSAVPHSGPKHTAGDRRKIVTGFGFAAATIVFLLVMAVLGLL
jgi:hypothetical protein